MKFLCLSYWDEKKFDRMSESERETFIKECFAYDNVLRKDGHFARLAALQSARSARTLHQRSGKVTITDGPFADFEIRPLDEEATASVNTAENS